MRGVVAMLVGGTFCWSWPPPTGVPMSCPVTGLSLAWVAVGAVRLAAGLGSNPGPVFGTSRDVAGPNVGAGFNVGAAGFNPPWTVE